MMKQKHKLMLKIKCFVLSQNLEKIPIFSFTKLKTTLRKPDFSNDELNFEKNGPF